MPDVQRAGDLLIGNQAPQFEERGGGRVGTDSQRVEKISDQPDEEVAETGNVVMPTMPSTVVSMR